MVKDDVVVIDVGITRVEDETWKGYRIVGDVDYENVSKKFIHHACSWWR